MRKDTDLHILYSKQIRSIQSEVEKNIRQCRKQNALQISFNVN